jgi:hypothetical protein
VALISFIMPLLISFDSIMSLLCLYISFSSGVSFILRQQASLSVRSLRLSRVSLFRRNPQPCLYLQKRVA